MVRRLIAGFVVALMPLVGVVTPAASNGTACSNLAALTMPAITIQIGDGGAGRTVHAARRIDAMTLPAFCRVEATARPTSDSEIKFEVWIPPADAWNSKFQGVGNGGYQGAIGTRRWRPRCAAATPPPAPTPAMPATT